MRKTIFPIIIFAFIIGLISCTDTESEPHDSSSAYKTKTHKTIIITETHPEGQSLSNISITTKDFEHNISEVYENRDPVSGVFIADLDKNGFDEIYIITTAQGSGSYGTVIGFASNFDKSLSMIHFPDIQKEEKSFKGYMGHDTFAIEDQKLVRTFPLYNKEDTNQNPTNGNRKLTYGLYHGEAMWQLKIEKTENIE